MAALNDWSTSKSGKDWSYQSIHINIVHDTPPPLRVSSVADDRTVTFWPVAIPLRVSSRSLWGRNVRNVWSRFRGLLLWGSVLRLILLGRNYRGRRCDVCLRFRVCSVFDVIGVTTNLSTTVQLNSVSFWSRGALHYAWEPRSGNCISPKVLDIHCVSF